MAARQSAFDAQSAAERFIPIVTWTEAGRAVIAPTGEQIEIAAGDQQAVVVEVGGGLRSYSAGGRELVDGYWAD